MRTPGDSGAQCLTPAAFPWESGPQEQGHPGSCIRPCRQWWEEGLRSSMEKWMPGEELAAGTPGTRTQAQALAQGVTW